MIDRRRMLRHGELYAISPRAIHADTDRSSFFWLFGPPIFQNERCGSVCVVRISGPLEYHDDGCGDSYESIVKRVDDAFNGKDVPEGEEGGRPSSVVIRIDSPGGVVAGLHETVMSIRAMRKKYGIPLFTYVDETAYSAGFALACSTDAIYLPASGFCGSVGVISTLLDESKLDEKMGLKFVVLTSGERKADGHPHVPITDAMIDEEKPRVDQLALQFFQDVRRARGLSIDTIRGFQAKRFLGQEAVDAGVADEVMGWRRLIRNLNDLAQQDLDPLAALSQIVPSSRKPMQKGA